MKCVHLLTQGRFQFKDSNMQPKYYLACHTLGYRRATLVDSGKHALFSTGDFSRQAPATHLRHTFSGLAQASRALTASFWYQRFRTNRAAILESDEWKVAWSYVLNFSSYSRSKLINFSVDFSGIFQRSSNLNTYRNEAFKDIFSCSSHSL